MLDPIESAIANLSPAHQEAVRQAIARNPGCVGWVRPQRETPQPKPAKPRAKTRPAAKPPAKPQPKRQPLPTRPPCVYEGAIYSWCPAGNENLHRRHCLHDDGPENGCRRKYECRECEYYHFDTPH